MPAELGQEEDATGLVTKAKRKTVPVAGRGHLLIVEDEEDLQDLLSFNLSRDGYRVTVVGSGEAALKAVQAERPDLVLLDLMLPGIDGLEVCRRLKGSAETANLPVIMLTAKGEEADVVSGLEIGADDYVTKPFSLRVLTARLKAVLRQQRKGGDDSSADDETPIEIDGLEIRPDRHEVKVDGEVADLTATEFRLLMLLAGRPGRVFTRTQIIQTIHGGHAAVTDRSVDVQVVSLRRKLGRMGDAVKTIRGVGYSFRTGAN